MHATAQLNAALQGRFAIDRLIGDGGMTTVHLARDVRHNRQVARKILKPDLGALVGAERFLAEIQVTANVQHANLLPRFDFAVERNHVYFTLTERERDLWEVDPKKR